MNSKTKVLLGVGAALLFGTSAVYAATNLPVVSQACELQNGQLVAFGDGFSKVTDCARNGRIVTLGAPAVSADSFYVRTEGPIAASPGIASTVIHGCYPGDIAISGGMEEYSGPIANWRTVRSGPTEATGMNGWQTTVINEGQTEGQFFVAAKCLKVTK